MYRLLIVDDEEVEREGMAQFVSWSDYDIELVGTAWNGVEGFEKIQELRPDIVLTDIKMPVMNGIELIRKTKPDFPGIEFIVLSGYGEYEYTSQAMEEGVRHYLLKPCDEEKIAEVLEKVKLALEQKLQQKKQKANYDSTIRRLLPRAKEQVFRNILLGREQIEADYCLFMNELEGGENQKVRVLAIRFSREIDYLEQFVLENIMEELLERENLILTTAISNEVFFLLRDIDIQKLETILESAQETFVRFSDQQISMAVSNAGSLKDIRELYLQTEELHRMGGVEKQDKVLSYEMFRGIKSEMSCLVNYEVLQQTKDFGVILFELYLAFCKMRLDGYPYEKKEEVCDWIERVLYGESEIAGVKNDKTAEEAEWELLAETADFLYHKKRIPEEEDKEEKRFQTILHCNIQVSCNAGNEYPVSGERSIIYE